MTAKNNLVSSAPEAGSSASSTGVPPRNRKTGWGRRSSAILASLAVVGFAAALVTPTGMALAGPEPQEEAVTAFAAASEQAESVTITSGAEISPITRGSFEVYVTPKPEPEPVVASSGSGGGGGAVFYTGGGAPAEWMSAAGIDPADWGYVDFIVNKESGWNPNAVNRSSAACGLVQIMPMHGISNCHDPVVNLTWGANYAGYRYGGWAGAYRFWSSNHWW